MLDELVDLAFQIDGEKTDAGSEQLTLEEQLASIGNLVLESAQRLARDPTFLAEIRKRLV